MTGHIARSEKTIANPIASWSMRCLLAVMLGLDLVVVGVAFGGQTVPTGQMGTDVAAVAQRSPSPSAAPTMP
jgi:hypothetical protein